MLESRMASNVPFVFWFWQKTKIYFVMITRAFIRGNMLYLLNKVLSKMKVLQLEASHTVTVEEVFYDWLNSKLELKEISLPTYLCYETDFKRYHDSYAKHPIKEVSSLEIEHFLKNRQDK